MAVSAWSAEPEMNSTLITSFRIHWVERRSSQKTFSFCVPATISRNETVLSECSCCGRLGRILGISRSSIARLGAPDADDSVLIVLQEVLNYRRRRAVLGP